MTPTNDPADWVPPPLDTTVESITIDGGPTLHVGTAEDGEPTVTVSWDADGVFHIEGL